MKLSPTEKRLLAYMREAGSGTDVAIADVYAATITNDETITPRRMQQRIGATISRLNRKLAKECITPGQMKRTYRLVPR